MSRLKIYNSLSNSLEDFTPIDEKNVRLYLCGPTVYASPHIGNARPLVVFDVLYRLLKRLYNSNVTYVRNITDVDDKINTKAKANNISIGELTTAVIDEFHKNLRLLNVLPVTHEPRATNHIAEMLEIIEKLIENGFAYEAEGHVLFRVKKMSQYGMLSKRSLDDMIAGSRVEVAAYKEDPMDFVLWKPSERLPHNEIFFARARKNAAQDRSVLLVHEDPSSGSDDANCEKDPLCNDPAWSSKYGYGRPGWHIECSAMSRKYLGEQFDIHGGGQDLMFPHHENELAQNFGAFGCLMAKYWIHNGMLLVDNQKMSKSLGNIISLDDILKKYDGEVIRYVLLSAHYQKTLNWTDQIVTQSLQSLNRLYGALQRQRDVGFANEKTPVVQSLAHNEEDAESESNIMLALCANLNTPLALKCLHDIADKIYKSSNQNEINELCNLLQMESNVLGLLQKSCDSWFKNNLSGSGMDESEIQQLISERQEAKAQKNFKRADEIRAKLLDNSIQIEDTKEGTIWRSI
ncbi:cysteine--tRNA ligase [Alphaproteobacteria bacterium]|nr:cysteine--tRNA ligase [Alphaproteobacteria bacterium]